MVYALLIIENPRTGKIKQAPVGISWTTAFFVFFPALFRDNYKWAFIQCFLYAISFGLSQFYFMFTYNKLYIKDLISSGYKVRDVIDIIDFIDVIDVSDGGLGYITVDLGIDLPLLKAPAE